LPNDELGVLVDILTKDKGGRGRITEKLTLDEDYEKFYPDHSKYWTLIAAGYQKFGSNTVATLFRKEKGRLYKEILEDDGYRT
jgi:uncharacterized protein YaaW (UPF0174 family)